MKSDLNLLTLEQRLASWWRVLDSRAKLTFFATMLWGLIAHGSVLFRKYSAHDDVAFTHTVGATVESGRWMLDLLARLETFLTQGPTYSSQWFNGLLSLLCVAVTAALLVRLLNIRSRWLCVGIGGVFATVPVMASLFAFMFTAPYYMLALLMTAAGTWLICRSRTLWSYGAGIALLCAAMGIYQAYIPVAISVLLIHFLLELSGDDRADLRKTIFTAIRYGFALCAAVLAYYIISKCFLKLYDTQLNSYQGINKMGREGIGVYLSRLLLAYQAFFRPETIAGGSGCLVVMGLVWPYRLLLGITGLLLGIHMLRAGRRSILLAVQMAGVAALMPLAVDFIYVMCPDVHALMVYGSCSLFLLAACLADRLCDDKLLLSRLLSIACAVVIGVFCLIWCRYDNALYMQSVFNQERTVSYFNTMVSRIKATEGYRDELPVVYVNWQNKQDQTLTNLHSFPYIWPYEDATDLINDAAAKHYLDKWSGFYAEEVSFAHPDIEAMPCYPDDGSIRIIDDVVVVKFG